MNQRPSATAICEGLLRKERAYNVEHSIRASENVIIERMLERGPELKAVYEELWTKLKRKPDAVKRFLSIILRVGAHWTPNHFNTASQAYRRHIELRSEISELAGKLASLLRERTELSESSGFHSSCTHHIVDLIEAASQSNWDFRLHLSESLSALRYQYDMKYWPSPFEVVDAIAEDARSVEISPSNPITEAGTRSPKRSKADSFRALQVALEDDRQSLPCPFGADFHLSDESWATFLNVMLDLEPDELVDGPYIKRLRQRDRDAGRNEPNVQ